MSMTSVNIRSRGRSLLWTSILLSGSAAQAIAAVGPLDEELIITARKKEERLIEAPVAVSPFDANRIDELGLDRIDDLARFTPGFAFSSGLGRQPASDRPIIRGLTTIRNGIANASSATVFVDGVYIGGSSQTTELYNLERVEVLRGPQSALYGRNTYAGAINYVTRRPTDEFTGQINVTGAEHDTAGITGWVSGPIIDDRLGVLIAAGHRQYGGEYRNLRDGSRLGGEQSHDVTAKLRWTPTASIDISLKAGWQQTDDDHYAAFLQGREWNNCCFRSADAPRAREYFIGEAHKNGDILLFTDLLDAAGGAGTELNRRLASLSVDWDFTGGYTLTSNTGYVDDETRRGIDTSYAAYDPVPFGPSRGSFNNVDWIEQTDLSQEIRLRSPEDHAVRWTTGVYYYHGEAEVIASNRSFLDNSGQIVVTPAITPPTHDRIRNTAWFGGAEWDIAERWTVAGELRWARDRIKVRNTQNYPATCNAPDSFRESFDSLTPRLTVSHEATDDRHYYANIAKGIKPGDYNSGVPALPDGCPDESFRAVDEETVWSYELGTKQRWWQRRIGIDLAVFYLDVEDQQLTQTVRLPDGNINSIIRNVGRTAVWGFETEFSLKPTDAIDIDISYAWARAEFRNYISTEQADLNGSNGGIADNLLLGNVSGNLLPRVPEHTASLFIRYESPIRGDWLWYISGDYAYESSRYAQEHNLIETGDRHLVGQRTGISVGHWDLSLWVTNLFDDDTPIDVQRFFDSRSGRLPTFPQQGPPGRISSPRAFVVSLPRGRQVGATVNFRF